MRKVMLVIDEIQQLVGLEAFLRRLGFDVLSLSKDSLVSDALLSFPAEVVLASRHGRNVDGLKVAQKIRKLASSAPRMVLCYTGTQPPLTKDDEKLIDALMELPAAGENAIRLISQVSGLNPAPLLEKYRRFANAKLSKDEEIVIIAGSAAPSSGVAISPGPAWDPVKNPGGAATNRTERSNRYDAFLESHSGDFAKGENKRVLPRGVAMQKIAKLKEDSKTDKDFLDALQEQKIKFAEALFDKDEKKKT